MEAPECQRAGPCTQRAVLVLLVVLVVMVVLLVVLVVMVVMVVLLVVMVVVVAEGSKYPSLKRCRWNLTTM